MSLLPAMFQYIKKMVGVKDDRQLAFAPLATPFTNEDFLFLNTEIYQKDPAKYYEEALEFSQKANSIIEKANIWEIDTKDFLYEKYETILTNAKLIEKRNLTDAELAQQEKARKVLYEADETPTTAFKSYKRFEQQYNDIVAQIQEHKLTKPTENNSQLDVWSARLKEYEKALSEKEVEWKALGSKNEIESAIRAFDEPKENRERNVFANKWNEAKTLLSTIKSESAISGGEIYPMGCTPNNLYQYKGVEWLKVSLTKNDINTLTDEIKKDTTVNVQAIFGEVDVELESISFEICRVVLFRYWFKENLLLSRYWDYPTVKVSSGEAKDFSGLIPAYPIEFILVKNVNPILSPNSVKNEKVEKSIRSGLPVFIGPFLLKNFPQQGKQSKNLQIQTLTARQLSIIAKSVNRDAVNPGTKLTRRSGLRFLQQARKIQTLPDTSEAAPIIRDHRNPTVRDHRTDRPTTPVVDRGGFVWVNDHWERKKAETKTTKISGQVVDETNNAIAGAEISILDNASPVAQNYSSDTKGAFVIENIPLSNYHLTFRKDGYSIVEKDIPAQPVTDLGKITLSAVKPVESFLLLGVVYKKLPTLPNPIEKESYA